MTQTQIKSVQVRAGRGYWALARYPWGGEFHRFPSDCEVSVTRVIDTYADGSPRRVVAQFKGEDIGIEL